MRFTLSAVAAALLLAPAASAQPPVRHWSVTGNAIPDFTIALDSAVARGGRTSVRVEARDDPRGFAGPVMAIAVAPFAGRHVRITAHLRTASLGGGGAAVWARADTAPGTRNPTGAFATTQGRRVVGGTTDWTPVGLEIDVPANARVLFVGAFSTGRGTLWIDDVTLDAGAGATTFTEGFEDPSLVQFTPPTAQRGVAPSTTTANAAHSPYEAPRALAGRGLDNVVALARLVGYVRFFHPSEAAATTNWDELTVRGVRLVERAPNADSLAATLRALLAPVAPDVAVYRTGTAPPPLPAAPAGDSLGVVFWRHLGYGVPGAQSRVYSSVRTRVPAPNGRPRASMTLLDDPRIVGNDIPVPDPATPFVADLGAGVSARVPFTVYTSAPAVPDSLRTARPRPAEERFSVGDRATRLADVALLWMVPQHFYPYFDVVPVDWDGALRRALGEAAAAREETFDAVLQRLVAALRDGHGNVFRVQQGMLRSIADLRLGWVEGRVAVLAAGDSAAALGVRRGDEVVRIDGRPVLEALRDAESRVSGATPQWIRYSALTSLLSGAPGTAVALRVRDPLAPNAPERDVRVPRGNGIPGDASLPDKVTQLRPGVWYVDLGRVTDDDMDAATPQLAAATGIVFDMRGYPKGNVVPLLSHLADSTIRSAHFQTPLVTRPDHQGMQFLGEGWVIRPTAPRFRAKVAFLTGGGAISYAESTMGVAEENKLGAIVGATTAGTNGNVNPFTLPGGYTVTWTGLRVTKLDGTPHHGVGIRPTVPVEPTLRGLREGRDEVLERAIQIVTGRVS